jgi:hypothetical protein
LSTIKVDKSLEEKKVELTTATENDENSPGKKHLISTSENDESSNKKFKKVATVFSKFHLSSL